MTKVMPPLHPTRVLSVTGAHAASHLQVAAAIAIVTVVAIVGFLLRLVARVFRVIVESAASTVGIAVGLVVIVVVLVVTLFGSPSAADEGPAPAPIHPAATR